MKIDNAPVQEDMFQEDQLNQGWLQWFSAVGDALAGEWSTGSWNLSPIGMTETPSVEVVFSGGIVYFSIQWNDAVDFTSASLRTPQIGGKYLQVNPGVLCLWSADGALEKGIRVSSDTLNLPDGSFASGLLLEGTLSLLKQTGQGE